MAVNSFTSRRLQEEGEQLSTKLRSYLGQFRTGEFVGERVSQLRRDYNIWSDGCAQFVSESYPQNVVLFNRLSHRMQTWLESEISPEDLHRCEECLSDQIEIVRASASAKLASADFFSAIKGQGEILVKLGRWQLLAGAIIILLTIASLVAYIVLK